MARVRKKPKLPYVSEIDRTGDTDRVYYSKTVGVDPVRSARRRKAVDEETDEEAEYRRQNWFDSIRTYSDRLSEGFRMIGD